MKPNLFIVGAPKCGTTSLYYYLNQHPDVFFSEDKEPNFYNTDFIRKDRISEKDYLQLFAHAETKYAGEASPLYLMSRDAPYLIKKDSPDAKIIIMIRKPLDMMYSMYLQNQYNFVEDADGFEIALLAEDWRRSNLKETKTGEPVDRLFYTQLVSYADQIATYEKVFGKDNVHTIFFDDFKTDTVEQVKNTLEFLKLDTSANINYALQNSGKLNKYPKLAYFVHSPPFFIRKLARLFFKPQDRAKLYSFLRKINQTSKPEKDMVLSQKTKLRLANSLNFEVEKLESRFGRDLSDWKIQ